MTFSDVNRINFENFKFNSEFLKDYCNGAILLQSSYLYSAKSPIKTFHKSYLTIIDTLFFHEVVPITMHEEIEGIDSELELYIQYFDCKFREMHAVVHQQYQKQKEEKFKKLFDEEEEAEGEVEDAEEVFRRAFSQKIVKRIERARGLRRSKP